MRTYVTCATTSVKDDGGSSASYRITDWSDTHTPEAFASVGTCAEG